MTAPLLFLPMEEKNRELNSRVLIALHAIEAGFDVIICQQWELFASLSKVPPSIILFKGSNTVQARHMAAAKQAGHFVCSIEEEVLALCDDDEILRVYDPAARVALDLIFAQGEHQAALLASIWPEMADRIAVVGNPRADLLRISEHETLNEKATALRQRHGRFVLFNTNYGATNPAIDDIYGFFELCVRIGWVKLDRPADIQTICGAFLWERENFTALSTLALQLAKDGISVVLRPHPAENTEIWHRQLANIPGLSVVRDGSQLDWLKASELLVHSGCTTGLEAHLLGHPALTLIPGNHSWHDVHLSNRVNPGFAAVEPARQAIHDHLDGKRRLDADRASAEDHLHRYLLITPNQFAAERIVHELRTRHQPMAPHDGINIASIFSRTQTRLSPRRAAKVAFTRDEIDASIQACSKLAGRSAFVRLREIGPMVFHLSGSATDV